jgi:CBS domain-containing protein
MAKGTEQERGSYRTPAFENATVGDVMRQGVIGCPPDASLTAVAQMMATQHVHAIVVVDVSAGSALRGVILDMDMVRAAREGVQGRTAQDILGDMPATVAASDSLETAAEAMERDGTAHLIVLDDAHPVGVISSLDVAGAIAWGRA